MWPNLWENFRWADFWHPHHLKGLEEVPSRSFCTTWGACHFLAPAQVHSGTHEEIPLCFGHVLKEGVQDHWERQQWGEVAKGLHGVVHPASAIPEALFWKTPSWPILFWWSIPGLWAEIGQHCCQIKNWVWRMENTCPTGCPLPDFLHYTSQQPQRLWPSFSWYTNNFTKPLSAPVVAENLQCVWKWGDYNQDIQNAVKRESVKHIGTNPPHRKHQSYAWRVQLAKNIDRTTLIGHQLRMWPTTQLCGLCGVRDTQAG